MDATTLEAAAKRYREAEAALEAARDDLQAEAVAARRAGAKQVEVSAITGWTREYLRKLVAAADARDAETPPQN